MEATRDFGPSTMPTLSELDRDLLHGGALVGGCRIVEPIAQDDSGILYVADDPMLQRHVLIREHFPQGLAARGDQGEVVLVTGSDAAARNTALTGFLRGARWLTRFDHPSIARALRVWEERGTAYLMMPLYEGETLAATLQRLGVVDETWLRRLLAGLCDALAVLHGAGVYHLGLSPDNVWVTPDGHPMLLDLSTAGPETQRLLDDSVDRQYAPIERFEHGSTLPVGPWTDIYSVGAIAHQALLGRPPVSATVLGPNDVHAPIAEGFPRRAAGRTLRVAPSAAFLAAVDRALAVHPGRRPKDLAALRALLDLTGSAPVPQAAVAGPKPAAVPDPAVDGVPDSPSTSVPAVPPQPEPPVLHAAVEPVAPVAPAHVASGAAPDVDVDVDVEPPGPDTPADPTPSAFVPPVSAAPSFTAPSFASAPVPPPTSPRQEPVFGPAPAAVHAGAGPDDRVDPAAAAAIAMAVSSLPWANDPPGHPRDDEPPGFRSSGLGREPGLGPMPTWTMPAPSRRKKKSGPVAPRVVAAGFGLLALVGMAGWYVADHPELIAAWQDVREEARPDDGSSAAPTVATAPGRDDRPVDAGEPAERVLADAPPAAGPAAAPAPVPTATPDVALAAPPPPLPAPAPAPVTPPPPPPQAVAPEPAPVPAPTPPPAPAPKAKARPVAKAPPPEQVAITEDTAAPTSPRGVCGSRTNFALFRCMDTQCRTARYGRHPQCVLFRAENPD